MPNQTLNLAPLPADAERLLRLLDAPPRLLAHLRLVHDVALRLTQDLQRLWPMLTLDVEALCFGAAIHDIGKVWHPEELSGPGRYHEETGPMMLARHGITSARARFARTHASWATEEAVTLEDRLVALADHCWKGKRETQLEETIVTEIATAAGQPRWEVFLALDEVIATLAVEADRRLAWMADFPTE